MSMRYTRGFEFDRNSTPVFVLMDIDNVLRRLNGSGTILAAYPHAWMPGWSVEIHIEGETVYRWLVDRNDYGKNMPALYEVL